MSKLNKVEELKTKRFVIRKSLIGKNTIITFDILFICLVVTYILSKWYRI